MLLGGINAKYDVTVEHRIEVPIGAGFGTSAGGALIVGLALKEALDLPLTYNQIGKIAHVARAHQSILASAGLYGPSQPKFLSCYCSDRQ
jgi:pantoate kinase